MAAWWARNRSLEAGRWPAIPLGVRTMSGSASGQSRILPSTPSLEPGKELIQIAEALYFIAFRVGRIDDKLGRLIEVLEKRQGGK
jgi:hypothetical protein